MASPARADLGGVVSQTGPSGSLDPAERTVPAERTGPADAGRADSAAASEDVAAWRPAVRGLHEVLHAHFTAHAYPVHTHDVWTLLIVDDGAVRYGLDHREHGALRSMVTLLPPDVPHDGRPARPGGYHKRVLYLDRGLLGDDLIGAAVDTPALADRTLRRRVDQLHHALLAPGADLEAQSRLALICARLQEHLGRGRPRTPSGAGPTEPTAPARADRSTARALRDLLDARVPAGVALDEAAGLLGAHPAYLVRAFHREYGIPPHRYLTGRRVDLARRLLLAGHPAAEVAILAGFYDQSHLTRHFRRLVGTSPARFARSGTRTVVTGPPSAPAVTRHP